MLACLYEVQKCLYNIPGMKHWHPVFKFLVSLFFLCTGCKMSEVLLLTDFADFDIDMFNTKLVGFEK